MKDRAQWGSRFGFIAAAVGSAIGLGNIWRFPYQAYANGGGAFLIPYFFALLTAGIPLLIFEFGLGQKLRGSAPAVFQKLPGFNGKLEWIGWWQVFMCLAIATYYTVVIAWIFSYILLAVNQGWGADTKSFFYGEFLQLPASGSPFDFGSIRWPILGALVVVWGLMGKILYHGVKKGVERVNRVFMPLLFVLVLSLAVRAIFLEGAATGINYLFQPDFSKIFNAKVWIAAYGQIFFSLSVSFAIMITYASYLPKKADIVNNAFLTGLINSGFSMLAGVLIFAILGHMAFVEGKEVSTVVAGGPGLVFITIPAALKYMPLPGLFGVVFFISLGIAGLSSSISLLQSIVSALDEKFSIRRETTVVLVSIIGFALSIPFATESGLLILDITDYFINNMGVIMTALLEIVLIGWVIKESRSPVQVFLQKEINEESDFSVGLWWVVSLKYVTLVVLGSMFFQNVYSLITVGYEGYPSNAIVLFGWAILGLVISLGILMQFTGGSFHETEGMDL
jgi:neurotransmitter:Na+ symporter, NSS family